MFTDTATRLNIVLTNEHRIAVEKTMRSAINEMRTQIEFTEIEFLEFVKIKDHQVKMEEQLDEMISGLLGD